MRIDDEIDKWGKDLASRFANLNLSPLFPAITQIVRNSVIRNFKEGGRYGSEFFGGGDSKWTQSGRAERDSGQTLRNKGLLANSIVVNISQANGELLIEVSSNLPYARVHQYGIDKTVQVREHTRMRRRTAKGTIYARGKRGQKLKQKLAEGISIATVEAHSRKMKMPERPYLVLQNDDIIQIKELIQRRLPGLL